MSRTRSIPAQAFSHRWRGVFPAITTQMHRDGSLDIEAMIAGARGARR